VVLTSLKSSQEQNLFEEARLFLMEYRRTGDRESLPDGLAKLIDSMSRYQEPRADEGEIIPCSCCGTLNNVSQPTCYFCGSRLIYSSQSILDSGGRSKDAEPASMPLPPAADPLVQLLRQAEQGQCTPESSTSLLASFTRNVEQMEMMLKTDRSMPDHVREVMTEAMDTLKEAVREARSFAEEMDPSILQSALEKVSAAAVKMSA